MCFSSTASFATAAVTCAIGAMSVSRCTHPTQIPLAAMPILFGVQQAIEGLLWLSLPDAAKTPISNGLALAFLLVARAFWPMYAPLAAALVEPEAKRRRAMTGLAILGVGIGLFLLGRIVTGRHDAAILNDHIVYRLSAPTPRWGKAVYLAATCLPLMLSSHRMIVVFGAVVLCGTVVAHALYWQAFISVWCFFAAAASVVILAHFQWSRGARLSVAVG